MKLETQVVWGLFLGIGAGAVFGELLEPLQTIGEAYIQLMQMTVLPYMVVSLIHGLGSLSYARAALLARRGGAVLLVFWAISLLALCAMPWAYPDWETASFFSSSLVEERESLDFLGLYIPANPFRSLADGIVPAAVVFSIAAGAALIGMERKEQLLEPLSVLQGVLTRIAEAVVRLSPLGIFAITAHAAGTMGFAEFGRLGVYFLAYLVTWAVLTFWAVPALATALMPLGYRDVVVASRTLLITAFATQNLFIVLPLIAQRVKELLAHAQLASDDTDALVDAVLPVAFTFPGAGVLLTLSFVPFAAWFSDSPMAWTQYPTFLGAGLLSFFGNVWLAMPFLLDLLRIPIDLFQLFLAADVLIAPVGTVLAAMQTMVLVLLTTSAVQGGLSLRVRHIVRYGTVGVALLVGTLLGVRVFLETTVEARYTKADELVQMRLPAQLVQATIRTEAEPPPQSERGLPAEGERSVASMPRVPRDLLRVCYFSSALPFAFVNARDELVGFDVDMAHGLARDLGLQLEFHEIELVGVARALDRDVCDIVMSGYAITPKRAHQVAFSSPYFDATLAFIVKDHRRHEFSSLRSVQAHETLRLALPEVQYYKEWVSDRLPKAEFTTVDSPREFFESSGAEFDALVYPAESGAAWSLIYPSYTAVVPEQIVTKIPLAYAVQLRNSHMLRLVNTWLELKQRDGTIQRAFDYWILGRGATPDVPRWSVVRNLLGWVD